MSKRGDNEELIAKILLKAGFTCPTCNGTDIMASLSPCKDPECCGIADALECLSPRCNWQSERNLDDWDLDTIERILELVD